MASEEMDGNFRQDYVVDDLIKKGVLTELLGHSYGEHQLVNGRTAIIIIDGVIIIALIIKNDLLLGHVETGSYPYLHHTSEPSPIENR